MNFQDLFATKPWYNLILFNIKLYINGQFIGCQAYAGLKKQKQPYEEEHKIKSKEARRNEQGNIQLICWPVIITIF